MQTTNTGTIDSYYSYVEPCVRLLTPDPDCEDMDYEANADSRIAQETAIESGETADIVLGEKESKSKSQTTNDVDVKEAEFGSQKRSGRQRKENTQEQSVPHHLSDRIILTGSNKYSNEESFTKSRREYKNYEEMVSCINLLKYMDWEKIDPKVHQNSPCIISLTPRLQSANDSYVFLVHGVLFLFRERYQITVYRCTGPDKGPEERLLDDSHINSV